MTLYYVDAPTFQILGNLKIVATGLAGQCLLRRRLSRGKWLALGLLTLGAAASQVAPSGDAAAAPDFFSGRAVGYASALCCVFLSATMGVFTEAYMKGNRASDAPRGELCDPRTKRRRRRFRNLRGISASRPPRPAADGISASSRPRRRR